MASQQALRPLKSWSAMPCALARYTAACEASAPSTCCRRCQRAPRRAAHTRATIAAAPAPGGTPREHLAELQLMHLAAGALNE